MLNCSNTILSNELTLFVYRYCIFLCQFVISYTRTVPQTASTVPILRRPSALSHSTMVSKVPWMGWLSWILQALVVSNFMSPSPRKKRNKKIQRVLCREEMPHEMTRPLLFLQFGHGFLGGFPITFSDFHHLRPGVQSWNFEGFTGASRMECNTAEKNSISKSGGEKNKQ